MDPIVIQLVLSAVSVSLNGLSLMIAYRVYRRGPA